MNPPEHDHSTVTNARAQSTANTTRDNAVSVAFGEMLARARTGQSVRAEDYCLPSDPASADVERVLDLVYAEYLARCETGSPPHVNELAERFPHLAERIRRQVEMHEALESEFLPASDTPAVPGAAPAAVPATIGRYRIITVLGVCPTNRCRSWPGSSRPEPG